MMILIKTEGRQSEILSVVPIYTLNDWLVISAAIIIYLTLTKLLVSEKIDANIHRTFKVHGHGLGFSQPLDLQQLLLKNF